MEADFLAVHQPVAAIGVVFGQLFLVCNMVIRRRYQIQLNRLLATTKSNDKPKASAD
jgi:hypothetical protein